MVQAIVLAGGSTSDSLKEYTSVKDEALIEIGSKKMIEYVIEALKQSKQIEGLIVIGPKELAEYLPSDVILVNPGNSILENLQIAIKNLSNEEKKVLLVTSDIPFLTSSTVDNFLKSCQSSEADFYYPIITKEACEKAFPQVTRTYVTLKDGIFTGGNIFLLNPKIVSRCCSQAEKLIQNRKKPLKMLRFIGIAFLIKFLFKQLTIKDLERKVSSLFNIKGVAIISDDAQIAVDVDKPEDLQLTRKYLK